MEVWEQGAVLYLNPFRDGNFIESPPARNAGLYLVGSPRLRFGDY